MRRVERRTWEGRIEWWVKGWAERWVEGQWVERLWIRRVVGRVVERRPMMVEGRPMQARA